MGSQPDLWRTWSARQPELGVLCLRTHSLPHPCTFSFCLLSLPLPRTRVGFPQPSLKPRLKERRAEARRRPAAHPAGERWGPWGEGDPRSPGTELRKNPGAGSRAGAPGCQSCPSFSLSAFSVSGFSLRASAFQPPSPSPASPNPRPSRFHPFLPIENSRRPTLVFRIGRLEVHSVGSCARDSCAERERTRMKSEQGGGVLCLHRVCV